MKEKKLKVEITELFMAQADKMRKFFGTIRRSRDVDGNHVVYGKIEINDGHIFAIAPDQNKLGENLDEMVKLILDANLHETDTVTAVNYLLTFENKRIYLN